MEMRKFMVTVHEDGTISAIEYIPPEDQSLTTYQAGCKDTRTRVENILKYEIKKASHNAGLSEYSPRLKAVWSLKADAYAYILEKIRQTILK